MLSTALTWSLIGWAVMTAIMTLLWLFHLRVRNAAWVDVGWAAGIGVLGCLYAAFGTAHPQRRLLLAAITAAAGFRLALHLGRRIAAEGVEEGRYRELRESWPRHQAARFFVFFQIQALLDVILAIPFIFIAQGPETPLGSLEWIGAALWLAGFAGESAADRQLRRFKADPANQGKVCDRGWWALSRHPNYFFEWLMWLAYAVIALSTPLGWIGFIAPLLVLVFVLFITGIPPTEAQALRRRGEAYRAYQRRTSAFVPWFPKSG